MPSNDVMLWCFSVAFIVTMTCLLVMPILWRKSDVFTTWNMFLLGAIVFTGFSGINATRGGHYLPSYVASDYALYYLGVLLFYGAAFAAYFGWKYPRRLAGRRLLRWPKLSGMTLVVLVFAFASVGMFQAFSLRIPLLGQLLFQFGVAMPVFAFTCAFIAWYRSPSSPMLIALLLTIGGIALFQSLSVGGSRRYMMSALAVAPISLYWVWLRYKPTPTIVAWILAVVFIGVPLLKGHALIRHHSSSNISAAQRTVELLKKLPSAIMRGGSSEGFMGQDSVEVALLTIHMLHDKSNRLEVTPFNCLYYILVNPIPRSYWPEKPVSLGLSITKTSGLTKKGIHANLGVNVSGQCYYDGGFLIHILYGVIFGSFLRFYDELLVRQAGNPLLIGGFVFMAPQIIGFSRGGMDTIGLQIILGFLSVLLANFLAKLFLGSGITYPRTDHIVDYPVLRSPSDWAKWMQSYTAPSVARRPYDEDDEE